MDCHLNTRTGKEQGKANTLPPELVKATIHPMGVPLATDQISGGIQAATGNELIIHRLEEIEVRKGPERICAKVKKYTTYALRGFGSFGVNFGRGLYGAELQKSLRRQANTPKRNLWEMKIQTLSPTG